MQWFMKSWISPPKLLPQVTGKMESHRIRPMLCLRAQKSIYDYDATPDVTWSGQEKGWLGLVRFQIILLTWIPE